MFSVYVQIALGTRNLIIFYLYIKSLFIAQVELSSPEAPDPEAGLLTPGALEELLHRMHNKYLIRSTSR
jgi:hypothetical protein